MASHGNMLSNLQKNILKLNLVTWKEFVLIRLKSNLFEVSLHKHVKIFNFPPGAERKAHSPQ